MMYFPLTTEGEDELDLLVDGMVDLAGSSPQSGGEDELDLLVDGMVDLGVPSLESRSGRSWPPGRPPKPPGSPPRPTGPPPRPTGPSRYPPLRARPPSPGRPGTRPTGLSPPSTPPGPPPRERRPPRQRPIGLTPAQARQLHAQIRAVMPKKGPVVALRDHRTAAKLQTIIQRIGVIINEWYIDPLAPDAEQVRRRLALKRVRNQLVDGLRYVGNPTLARRVCP